MSKSLILNFFNVKTCYTKNTKYTYFIEKRLLKNDKMSLLRNYIGEKQNINKYILYRLL